MKSKEQIQEQYPELFKGIGRFPGEPYNIHPNPSITPKQTPCRPIPVHLKQTFQQEIEKMLAARVIKPVHEAALWINSFILAESTGKSNGKPKLQICLDPTNLNKAIICEPYCFRTPEKLHTSSLAQLLSQYLTAPRDTGINCLMRNLVT